MEIEKLVLANDKFSKEFFESMRLRYSEFDISKERRDSYCLFFFLK